MRSPAERGEHRAVGGSEGAAAAVDVPQGDVDLLLEAGDDLRILREHACRQTAFGVLNLLERGVQGIHDLDVQDGEARVHVAEIVLVVQTGHDDGGHVEVGHAHGGRGLGDDERKVLLIERDEALCRVLAYDRSGEGHIVHGVTHAQILHDLGDRLDETLLLIHGDYDLGAGVQTLTAVRERGIDD